MTKGQHGLLFDENKIRILIFTIGITAVTERFFRLKITIPADGIFGVPAFGRALNGTGSLVKYA